MSTKIIIGDIILVVDTDEKQKLILPYNIDPKDLQYGITDDDGKYTFHLWGEGNELLSLAVKSKKVGKKHGA